MSIDAPVEQTPSQTVGPFFGYALPYDDGPRLVPSTAPGAIRLHGTVFDGAGDPVPDAILELWQPDADGMPVHARGSLTRDGFTFTGFGRAAVDADGHYSFATLRPGGEHPYALITVFARGLMHHLFTRAYFPVTRGWHGRTRHLPRVRGCRPPPHPRRAPRWTARLPLRHPPPGRRRDRVHRLRRRLVSTVAV